MSDEWQDKANPFASSFNNMPRTWAEAIQYAEIVREQFHARLAAELEAVLNQHVKAIPQDTLAEKRTAAADINHDLRSVGLAIRCPTTNSAAILVADHGSGDKDRQSRFRLQARDMTRGKIRTEFSKSISDLALMPDPPRKEHLSRKR